jgi:hypothetical protein
MSISITARAHPHQHPIAWLGAKVALALFAAGLETRYAATPSVDNAMSWVLAGE